MTHSSGISEALQINSKTKYLLTLRYKIHKSMGLMSAQPHPLVGPNSIACLKAINTHSQPAGRAVRIGKQDYSPKVKIMQTCVSVTVNGRQMAGEVEGDPAN